MADTNPMSHDAVTKINCLEFAATSTGHPHKSVAIFANSVYNKDLIGMKNVMSICVLSHYTNLLRTVSWHGKTIGVPHGSHVNETSTTYFDFTV